MVKLGRYFETTKFEIELIKLKANLIYYFLIFKAMNNACTVKLLFFHVDYRTQDSVF